MPPSEPGYAYILHINKCTIFQSHGNCPCMIMLFPINGDVCAAADLITGATEGDGKDGHDRAVVLVSNWSPPTP